jgi:hypothetical protein
MSPQPRPLSLRFATWWRAGLVAVAAALIWVAHYQRWTPASWQIPLDYYVDAHETLARLKAASEGDIWPLRPQVVERLGAPFGAHWNAYPTPDKPLMLVLGALVHVVGLYAAANLGLVLAYVTAALAFYFVARWMRCRWEWAAAGALLFAFAYYSVHRGLSHFSLVFSWTVPVGLLAVWLVAGSRRLGWRHPGAIVCVVAAVALGLSNPYNLLFWLQLMGWAVVIQWFGERRRANLHIGVAAMAIAFAAFAIGHAETWLYTQEPAGLPLLARNYAGTEIYALKPVEMFIPPAYHQWDWLAFFGHRYIRWSGWRGEVFLPYLGLAGIAGFIWLALATLRQIVRRRPLPGQALSVGWVIAYASIGGITNLLALFAGFQVFRATNRAVIFISAMVVFFLMMRLSRLTAAWPAWLRISAAACLAGVGVYEQLPRRQPAHEVQALVNDVECDRHLGRELEAALPAGAMVFQLPVLGFPEVATPHLLNDYEHFRPYLSTSTLRFSYGATKTRARSRWQRDLEGRPMKEVVPRLESYGFAALYLNRRAYVDRADGLLRELDEMGYSRRIEGRVGDQVVVLLQPAANPLPPLGETLTFGRGWHLQPDDGVRWAYAKAALSYFNPYPHAVAVDVRFTLAAVTPRPVMLEWENRPVHTMDISSEPGTFFITGLVLAPGVNRLALHSPTPPARQGFGPNQLRSFGLHACSVELRRQDDGTPAVATLKPGQWNPPESGLPDHGSTDGVTKL